MTDNKVENNRYAKVISQNDNDSLSPSKHEFKSKISGFTTKTGYYHDPSENVEEIFYMQVKSL